MPFDHFNGALPQCLAPHAPLQTSCPRPTDLLKSQGRALTLSALRAVTLLVALSAAR